MSFINIWRELVSSRRTKEDTITITASTVLKGYSHLGELCPQCGNNYICIESTDDPNTVLLRCWRGANRQALRTEPLVTAALDQIPSGKISCPDPLCPVRLPEDDLPAQRAHMERCHPDIVRARIRAAERH